MRAITSVGACMLALAAAVPAAAQAPQPETLRVTRTADGGEGSLRWAIERNNTAPGRFRIGAETRLFSLSGSAVIAAPYMTGGQRVVGAIGVIGPARLNYARVIPLVDYTARVLGRMLDGQET